MIGSYVRVCYMAVSFVTTGYYIVQPVAIVWMANNLNGHYKRGIVASNVCNPDAAPRYTVGYSVSLTMMLFCGLVSTIFAADS